METKPQNPNLLDTLQAISPLDGRYWDKLKNASDYFSEFALFKYRVRIEVEYFISLCELKEKGLKQLADFEEKYYEPLRQSWKNFSLDDAKMIKEFEKITNHDVKAVEYFVKKKMDDLSLSKFKEFIHFGLTSQDVNNTAIPLSLKDFLQAHYFPQIEKLIDILKKNALSWIEIPILARTHGQPATPTRLGKEYMVFVERLENQFKTLKSLPIGGKFGGATGNFNAHFVAYPNVDWIEFGNRFLTSLGLERHQYTTQIDHYDDLGAILDNCKRINTILIDLAVDTWLYISLDYFKQTVVAKEVGSSAMPHKVNPIDFENAEGNFGVANSFFEFLSRKLPVSRLQRDLTDSTVLRNLGVPFSHGLLGVGSLVRGLGKLNVNYEKIKADLEDHWEVVSEAIQTVLRREGVDNPYEMLKDFSRTGQKLDKNSMEKFIEGLSVSDAVKMELRNITPFTYIGVVPHHK